MRLLERAIIRFEKNPLTPWSFKTPTSLSQGRGHTMQEAKSRHKKCRFLERQPWPESTPYPPFDPMYGPAVRRKRHLAMGSLVLR
jgi:hypothetical protein